MTDPHTSDQDVSRAIRSWLHEDRHEDASRVAGAVLDHVEATPQRRATWWSAWRMPLMNKLVSLSLGAAAVVVALVIGTRLLGPPDPRGVGVAASASPSPTPAPTAAATPIEILPTPTAERSAPPSATPVGGTVEYQMDGAPATTNVDAVADGTSVWGTAVTTFLGGTHTVRLECAARSGDLWALFGTSQQTTVSGERAGDWSGVVVRDGAPQQLGILLSISKAAGQDCTEFASGDLTSFDVSIPVESGELVPPPDPAR